MIEIEEILKEYPCLSEDDFGLSSDLDSPVLIMQKTGVQKLIEEYRIKTEIVSTSYTPYNFDNKKMVDVGFAATVTMRGRAFSKGSKEGFSPAFKYYDTTGECHHKSKGNKDFHYELGLAELRALSKLVRKICGLYQEKIISIDEYLDQKKKKSVYTDIRKPDDSIEMQQGKDVRDRIKSRLKGFDAERSIQNKVGQ